VEAQAFPLGETSLVSGQSSVTWEGFASLPPSGSLILIPGTVQPLPAGGQQAFTVYATDAAGNAAANVNLEMSISGVDNFNLLGTTDFTSHASFVYQDVNPGVASVIVSGFIDGLITYSDIVSVPWTLPTTTSGGSGTISISITAPSVVTLPNTLQLSGAVSDSSLSAGSSPTIAWSQSSGPGTVTFTNQQQTVTNGTYAEQVTSSFSHAGTYVLELSASDATPNSGSVQWHRAGHASPVQPRSTSREAQICTRRRAALAPQEPRIAPKEDGRDQHPPLPPIEDRNCRKRPPMHTRSLREYRCSQKKALRRCVRCTRGQSSRRWLRAADHPPAGHPMQRLRWARQGERSLAAV
jgi:hypothetical protein